jgi:hypothetical protein
MALISSPLQSQNVSCNLNKLVNITESRLRQSTQVIDYLPSWIWLKIRRE